MKLAILIQVAIVAVVVGYVIGRHDGKKAAERREDQADVLYEYGGPECVISVVNGKIRDTRLPMMKLAEQIPLHSPKVTRTIEDLMDECTYAQYPLRQRLCDPSTVAQYDHINGWSCGPQEKQ